MLRLERMEISGFKSFSDKTDVRFRSGITAVVGPNGCGKSNIGDAINWVLGEQSPRMLRGKQMADVIFAGSEARKPVGMAEVSLYLAGGEGLQGADHGNVVVTRRLFRSGESEYLLNGKRTRLKDIQQLLERGHVGARTYATIEQGRIDQIVNAKPKDRRLLIEDAAGIGGYKHKRHLTELKLEATQANLLRVNDVVVEVERQIRSLKRQAGMARRYRRLRDEMRAEQALHFASRAHHVSVELERARSEEAACRDAEAELAARQARHDSELQQERSALDTLSQSYRENVDRIHRLEIEIDRGEVQVRGCRERIAEAEETAERQARVAEELQGRLSASRETSRTHQGRVDEGRTAVDRLREELVERQAEVEAAERNRLELRRTLDDLRRRQFEAVARAAECRNRLRSVEEARERNRTARGRLEADHDDAGARLSRLRDEATTYEVQAKEERARVEELRGSVAVLEERIAVERKAESELQHALAQARAEAESAAATVATLEDVATRFAGVSDGVRALLGEGSASGLRTRGVVADYIEAPSDVEAAAEGYLEGFLPTVIVEDDADISRAAELLRRIGAGRTGLISQTQPAGGLAVGTSPNGRGEIPEVVLADPRVHGRLRERLKLRTTANGVIQDRVGDAVLVDRLETALELHRAHPSTDYITDDGDVVYASGVVHAGGERAGDRGLLAHGRRTEEAKGRAEVAAERAAAGSRELEACRERLARDEATIRVQREALDAAAQRLVELDLHARRSIEDREKTDRHQGVLVSELAALAEEAVRLEESCAAIGREVESSGEVATTAEQEFEERNAGLAQAEERAARTVEAATGLREKLAALQQRQESIELEAHRLSEAAAELESRLTATRSEIAEARRRGEQARELMHETERRSATLVEERESLGATVAGQEREIEERRRGLEAREKELKAIRESLEAKREATREAELSRTRAEGQREHLDDLCRQELGRGADETLQQVVEGGGDPAAVDPPEVEAKIEQLKAKIDRIGPVNMTAIEEFAELEERHTFLISQRQDLEQSMASLRETIRRINRTSRDRFRVAFEAIRDSYREIFKLLFNGGRADLRLEEGEDVLECGVEILAQPPGKRLANINLLSGGEKALSAIALLFAVFRFQPSPFCLLDEVDAALDDVNVGRFTRMLAEYATNTQFIIVTHNKLTMEVADLLYGVTMQEPGVSKLVSMELH